MVKKISIQEALNFSCGVFIDVRTPLEVSEGMIPGAINIPILSDEERVEIGTLYKQKGGMVARERGLDIVSPKLPSIYQKIKKVSEGLTPVLYCWRGGLRSSAIATMLDLTGMDVALIEGGYKSYRREVLEVLNSSTSGDPTRGHSYPFELVTLYGLTGGGKTALLLRMKKEGLSVIDLEQLASHRGSVFGHIGMTYVQTQKNFEALLYHEIRKYERCPIVFVEGESQRIGPVVLPKSWMDQMKKGRKVLIRSSLEVRKQRIFKEYFTDHLDNKEGISHQIEKALFSIQKRLGGDLFGEIYDLFKQENYEAVVGLLLERYYDRNYKYSAVAKDEDFALVLENNSKDDEKKAIEALISFFNLPVY